MSDTMGVTLPFGSKRSTAFGTLKRFVPGLHVSRAYMDSLVGRQVEVVAEVLSAPRKIAVGPLPSALV